jgi:hypothetical protein
LYSALLLVGYSAIVCGLYLIRFTGHFVVGIASLVTGIAISAYALYHIIDRLTTPKNCTTKTLDKS